MVLILKLALAAGCVLMQNKVAHGLWCLPRFSKVKLVSCLHPSALVGLPSASGSLHLATVPPSQTPHAARSCSAFLPDLAAGSPCDWLNQIPHALHSSGLYPDISNGRIHPRSDPPDCLASDADILSLNIPLPADHSIWHRYVLPSHDHHNVQRSKGYAKHS